MSEIFFCCLHLNYYCDATTLARILGYHVPADVVVPLVSPLNQLKLIDFSEIFYIQTTENILDSLNQKIFQSLEIGKIFNSRPKESSLYVSPQFRPQFRRDPSFVLSFVVKTKLSK